MSSEKIKIIIVDDHEIFRKGLTMVINKLKYAEIIGEATNGIEFLKLLETLTPDLVLMDIKMPEMNGIDATTEALKRYPKLKIVALSMFGDEEYLHNMIDAGVKGFMLKNINKEGLERAIKQISEGKNFFSEELLTFFTKKFAKQNVQELPIRLTRREQEILTYIAKGYSNKEIAEKLFISERTVNGHKANLISKTNTKNTVNLLAYAIKNKLIDLS